MVRGPRSVGKQTARAKSAGLRSAYAGEGRSHAAALIAAGDLAFRVRGMALLRTGLSFTSAKAIIWLSSNSISFEIDRARSDMRGSRPRWRLALNRLPHKCHVD